MGWNRRFPTRALALAAFVFVLEAATAQAQLFPDMYIKRRRPCCAAEDPRYRIVREQYFGYFPTCWRQFPPNWGCYPKDGAPNWEASLREMPLDPTSLLDQDAGQEGQGPGGLEPPGGRDTMPELPGDEPLFPDEGQQNRTPPPGQDPDPFKQGVGPSSGAPAPLNNPNSGGGPAIEAPRADAAAPPLAPVGEGQPATEGLPSALSDSGSIAPAQPDPTSSAATAPGLAPSDVQPPLAAPGLAQPSELAPGLTLPEGPVALPGDLGLEGNRPQAPPLAAPAAAFPGSLPPNVIPGPVTNGGGIGPIPNPTLDQIPPPLNADPRSERRRGPIANFLGRMRKR